MRRYPVLSISILLFVLILPSIFADLLQDLFPFIHDPVTGNLTNRLLPPAWVQPGDAESVLGRAEGSWEFILGTDELGRDNLSRIIYGSRVSLRVAVFAVVLSAFFGTALGLIAGFFGGWIDTVIMRLCDVMNSLQAILLALVIVAIIGPGFQTVVIVIAVVLWTRYTRVIRAETLALREMDFVARARVAGSSSSSIVIRHIFPNVVPTLIVVATLEIGQIILLEASLSFLGVGIPRPAPAWGLMVADGRELVVSAWWVSFFPGVAILLTVLALNVFGDWLRDRLDPKAMVGKA